VATGLDPNDAAAIVSDFLAQQAPYALARELLDGGASLGDTRRALVETGLDSDEAVSVVSEVQDARSGEASDKPGGGGGSLGLAILGVTVFIAGVVLLLGNLTGLFPTIPFAGFITTALGSFLFAAARRGR